MLTVNWPQFIEAVAANLVASLLAAAAIYALFQRASTKLEQMRQERDNRNLVTAMLLQQFPVLLERAHGVESDAFRAAMGVHSTPHKSNLVLANEARLASNLLESVNEGVDALGVRSVAASDFVHSARHLARAALALARHETDAHASVQWSARRYCRAAASFAKDNVWLSHAERIELLLDHMFENVGIFETLEATEQCLLLCNVLEAIGHIAALFGKVVREEFLRQVGLLVRDTAEVAANVDNTMLP